MKKSTTKNYFLIPIFLLMFVFLTVDAFAAQVTQVNVIKPTSGEIIKGNYQIEWSVTGLPASDSNFVVELSSGGSWSTIIDSGGNLANKISPLDRYVIWGTNYPTKEINDGTNYKIRVIDWNTQIVGYSEIFTVDNTKPISSVSALHSYKNTAIFDVAYTKSDATSGVNHVELYYNKDGVGWVFYKTFTDGINFDTTTLGDGTYQFYTRATDVAGNVESAPTNPDTNPDASTIVDTVVPTATLIMNPTGLTNTNSVTYTPTCSDIGSGLASCITYVSNNGGVNWNQISTTTQEQQYTMNTDGTYLFKTTAIDNAGNDKTTDVDGSHTVIKDMTAPIVNAGTDKVTKVQITQDATTFDATSGIQTYAWTQVSGLGVITFGSASAKDTTISASTDGVYIIRLTVTDNAENSASDEISFTWDTTIPTATFTSFSPEGLLTKVNEVTFTSLCDDIGGSGIESCVVEVNFNGEGYNVINSPYPLTNDGPYDFILTATDKAGNTATTTKQFTRDATAPLVVITNAPSTTTYLVGPSIDAQATCDGVSCTGLKIYLSDTDLECNTKDYNDYSAVSFTITTPKWVCMAAVDAVGNIGYSDAKQFKISSTIQGAIISASEGDTINVAAGTYTENVNVNKPLTLKGASSATVTVNALSASAHVFNINANSVDISGFTAKGATGTGSQQFAGINLQANNRNCNIHDNILTGNEYGILLIEPENTVTPGNNVFTSNTASSNSISGIEMQHSYGNTFTNNIANSNKYGFKLDSARHNTFTDNTANSNNKGFYLTQGQGTGCNDNTFTGNTANLNTQHGIHLIGSNDHVTLTSNIFDGNLQTGIKLQNVVTNPIINNNNIINNPTGIYISNENSPNIPDVSTWTVSNNKITGNTNYGVSNLGTGTLNAENNYWGSAEPNFETAVTVNVDYDPWAEDESFTRFYAPVLNPVGNQIVNEGSKIQITLAATDNDVGDSLSYSKNVDSVGTLEGLEGNVFTWTPTGVNQGANIVTFTVSDGYMSASETITITVNNVAPVVEAGADQTVNEGQEVSFSPTAIDAGGDSLTYNWNFGDFGTGTGQSTTHTYGDNGVYTVILSVNDGTTTVTDTLLIVTVNNVAPTITSATAGKTTVVTGETISFSGSATDPAGANDPLTYSWDFGDDSTSTVQNPTHSYSNKGNYIVNLTVNDGDGGSITSSNIQIVVNSLILDLSAEWNLVSVPKTLLTPTKANLLPENAVWYYDPTESNPAIKWKNPTTIDPGVGYWINNAGVTSLGLDYANDCSGQGCLPSQTIYLQPEWNLMGHMCTTTQDMEVAFPSGVYNNLFILRYNKVNNEFQIYSPITAGLHEFTQMTPGEGYWAFLASSSALPYTNIC